MNHLWSLKWFASRSSSVLQIMELNIKKWTDLFKDTKLVRPENESRNRKLLKEFITQNRIVYDNIVLKTSAKIKVYSIGSNEVNFSGGKKAPFLP